MPVETDVIIRPYKLQTTLKKRREGEDEPYEIITDESWHEPDGTQITDPGRIGELERERMAEQVQE
jgi:hypothetical protein